MYRYSKAIIFNWSHIEPALFIDNYILINTPDKSFPSLGDLRDV